MIEHLFAERQIPYTQPTPDLEKIAEECRAAVAAPCTGQDCINAILQALHSATAPLKEEIKELNEWKQGKKGIEEYYTVKYERDQLKEELERAATLLRENYGQISAAFIVKTEANKLKPEE